MPRKAKGPRLHFRKRKGHPSVWEIRDDGSVRLSTGTGDRSAAEKALAVYLERKLLQAGPVHQEALKIDMVLSLYGNEHGETTAAPERIGYAIDALLPYWGDKPVSYVNGVSCRGYVQYRARSNGTLRRELGVLQAALNHCAREGHLTSAPKVTLPSKPPSRERWLTRQEAAWLLRGARALNRDGRHLASFILCGLYTGIRKDTILGLRMNTPSSTGGYVDTTNGVLYRKPLGKAETNKRQRPARLPARYLGHLRRQASLGRRFVVEDYKGRRVGDIRKGWARARLLAASLAVQNGIKLDLSDVTPHVLKHTAITWALQRGATIWDVAGMFSTSIETIQQVYGHHSPDWQRSAVEAMDKKS